jgi:hypothetical protein
LCRLTRDIRLHAQTVVVVQTESSGGRAAHAHARHEDGLHAISGAQALVHGAVVLYKNWGKKKRERKMSSKILV